MIKITFCIVKKRKMYLKHVMEVAEVPKTVVWDRNLDGRNIKMKTQIKELKQKRHKWNGFS